MKVYVIVKEESQFSDYHICGVATDRERAEKIRDRCSRGYYEAIIEEWDTDMDLDVPDIYEVVFGIKSVDVCDIYTPDERRYIDEFIGECVDGSYGRQTVYVEAEDEETAIKKADEIRSKYLATQGW